jgi:hypothetical protein
MGGTGSCVPERIPVASKRGSTQGVLEEMFVTIELREHPDIKIGPHKVGVIVHRAGR